MPAKNKINSASEQLRPTKTKEPVQIDLKSKKSGLKVNVRKDCLKNVSKDRLYLPQNKKKTPLKSNHAAKK